MAGEDGRVTRAGEPRILVVGGGFSGLASAIALSHSGCHVDLVERSATWPSDGAGISIGGASLRALAALGVADEVIRRGAGSDGTTVRGVDGAIITRFAAPRLTDERLPGQGAILRPVLGEILVKAAEDAGATLCRGTVVDGFHDHDDGVDVRFSDDSRSSYDIVVAADGLRSEMRSLLLPKAGDPKFSGQGAWRAVVPRLNDVTETMLWVGATSKVGVNPISEREMYLFVNENKSINDRVSPGELLPRLRGLVTGITDPLLREIQTSLGPESLVLYRPMDALLAPLPWHRGRVVFVGDAVHATTPHLASGAGLGIEDALVLAEERRPAATDWFTAYERRRFDRCRMVVENSARLGEYERMPGGEQLFTTLQSVSLQALTVPI
ncbi:FAD-dependent monooxygenase [Paramicrobacterium chengjingii]|uniref:FAD-dependent monooxygenase n=1 Tax=Paramicrobacterium chengjingii TaxID=2769067 RepID=UPI001AB02E78|nr:FAD-dependent monooxygenase [Microbacterium chengjingii]